MDSTWGATVARMNKVFIVLVVIGAALAQGRIWFEDMPLPERTIPEVPDPERANRVISRGVTKLALELERVLGNGMENLIFSPVSVSSALALVLLGAGGRTSLEIANLLGVLTGFDISGRKEIVHQQLGKYFNSFVDDVLGSHLTFASGVFVQEGFPINPKFDDVARNIYLSEVFPLDFMHRGEEARLIINNWVNNRTEGHIKEILADPVSPASRVVIANAFFFNGEWEYPFYPGTRNRTFYLTPTQRIQIPIMTNTAEVPYLEDKAKGFKMFGMPYKGGKLFMYIIVPKDDLGRFISTLTAESVEDMINRTTTQMLIYLVPKMDIESKVDLRRSLEKLGVKALFNPQLADLSGLSKGVYASSVIHKVEIQVTETGTVASAATAVALERDGSVPVVRVDKPFLFFIYHKTSNSILFWGSVYRPQPYHYRK